MPLDPYANLPLDPLVAERQRLGALEKQRRLARAATLALDGSPTIATQEFDARAALEQSAQPPAAPTPPPGLGQPGPDLGIDEPAGPPAGAIERRALPGDPRDEDFANVIGGAASQNPRAHVRLEAPRADPGELNVNLGDGWQAADEDGHIPRPSRLAAAAGEMFDPVDNRMEPVSAPSGGGTFSMMSGSPEAENVVTQASRLQDAQAEQAIRQARGLPSEADIFRAQAAADARFGPKEQLEFEQAETSQREIAELMQYQRELNNAVAAGKIPHEQAVQLFEEARQGAAFRLQAMRGATMAPWGPNRNDVFGNVGALPPPG